MAAPKRKTPPRSAPARKSKADPAPRILVVEARFYDELADTLLAGAERALEAAGATWERITVPGALEIPGAISIATAAAEKRKAPFDGAVALGCVIQGETFHFEIVSIESARAIMDLTVERQLPIGNGILTVDNEAQASARAALDKGDEGGDAARAALAMIAIKREHYGRKK